MMHGDNNLAADVVSAVLSTFNSLPSRGKPSALPPWEFTVLAAVVAVFQTVTAIHRPKVISVATGTKSIGHESLSGNLSGCLLHDSHAEVLARRGFKRYILTWIKNVISNTAVVDDACPFIWNSGDKTVSVKDGCQFFMYISDSPCGAASIYPVKNFFGEEPIFNPTGAKIARVTSTFENSLNSEALRTKSGRSDILSINKSTSMCCSDKVSRWTHLGLQGSLLSIFLSQPIFLSGIVIGRDPFASAENQLQAAQLSLQRGLSAESPCSLPKIFMAPEGSEYAFVQGKAAVKFAVAQSSQSEEIANNLDGIKLESNNSDNLSVNTRKRKRRSISSSSQDVRPCGSSLNWIAHAEPDPRSPNGETVEVTIALTGLLQGAATPAASVHAPSEESLRTMIKQSSRLCRQRMAKLFAETLQQFAIAPLRIVPERSQTSAESSESASALDGLESVREKSYRWWKDSYCSEWYVANREAFFAKPLFRDWLRTESSVGSNVAVILR